MLPAEPQSANFRRDAAPSAFKPAGRFSCVIDRHPRFHLEALRWFASLTEVAGADPGDLVVHVVGSESSDALDFLKAQGVAVRPVSRFDPRSPHCNKISGALQLANEQVDGMVVLCDTDIVVLEDPRSLELPPNAIAGKPVDAPVPPLEVLLAIFAASGLTAPSSVPLPWGSDQWTVAGNNNGGLYLIPGLLLPRVASAWAHWAGWLLDRAELLDEWTVHVDQVAMALGLAAEGAGSVPLDVRWNTPSHDLTRIPADAPVPAIIHYHQEVDGKGLIRPTGTPSIDGRIAVANEAIGTVWLRAKPIETHRRWRDLTGRGALPSIDTGARRAMLQAVLEAFQPATVLEVGCGDAEMTRGLPMRGYLGIDSSAEALGRARESRPGDEFLVGSLVGHPRQADLTLCFELPGHQTNATDYRRLVEDLWQSANRGMVVSGPEKPAGSGDTSTRFHEPLSATLTRIAPDAEIYPISEEPATTTFVVLRPPTQRHPRDYSPTTLTPLIGRHPDPISLLTIRLHAWQTLGFYPDHAPRLWEYPVAAKLITQTLPSGSHLLDVGAGVTPLAPFLMSEGYIVDTVDPSPDHRTWPPQADWNEWGFLDYGRAGLAHRSWNCTVGQLPVQPPFDGIYSISVIEHIPAVARRALLADMSIRTRSGGLVILTIDLVRGRDDLWNRNLGHEVEIPAAHGTLQDVIREGAEVGLRLLSQEVIRDWGDTDVDIGMLALRRSGDSPSGARGDPLHALRSLGHRIRLHYRQRAAH